MNCNELYCVGALQPVKGRNRVTFMSREGKLFKNTIILAIGTFFPKLATFITLPILTAFLTKEEYGTYDLILTLVALILPAATLQIQSAAFRFLVDSRHDDAEKKSIITNIFAFIIPTSLIAIGILFFSLKSLTLAIRLTVCSYFLFDIISNASKQVVRGLSDNVSYTISAFISALGQVLLIFVMVVGCHKGLLGGVVALCAAEFLSTVYLFARVKLYKYVNLRKISFRELKKLLGYSWPMVPNSLSQWVMNVSDRLVITLFMGTAANAVYAVAYKIPSILTFAHTTFNMAWQENASIVAKDNDVASYYSKMFECLFDIVAGGMAILIASTPILFMILVRGDYDEALKQIPILYLGIFFFCLSSFWGGIYVALKETRAVATTTIAAAVCNLMIDLACIRWIGLYAASLSTLISYIALCAFRAVDIQRRIRLSYNIRHVIMVLVFLSVQCVISYQQTLSFNIFNFVVGMAACAFLNRRMFPVIREKIRSVISKK